MMDAGRTMRGGQHVCYAMARSVFVLLSRRLLNRVEFAGDELRLMGRVTGMEEIELEPGAVDGGETLSSEVLEWVHGELVWCCCCMGMQRSE